jgi:hypothetical protein
MRRLTSLTRRIGVNREGHFGSVQLHAGSFICYRWFRVDKIHASKIMPLPTACHLKPPNMLSNTALPHQSLTDAYSLALSYTQTRSCILNNARLFAKSKEKHLVELTELDLDQSEDPKTHTFTDASQLSEHFCQDESNVVHHNPAMEI